MLQNLVIQSIVSTKGCVVFKCKQGDFRISGVLDRGILDERETTINLNFKHYNDGGWTIKNVIQTEDKITILTNHPSVIEVLKFGDRDLDIVLEKTYPGEHTGASCFFKEMPLLDLVGKRLEYSFSSTGEHIGECWIIATNLETHTTFDYYLSSDTETPIVCNYTVAPAFPVELRPTIVGFSQNLSSISLQLSKGPDCVFMYDKSKTIKLLKKVKLVEKK